MKRDKVLYQPFQHYYVLCYGKGSFTVQETRLNEILQRMQNDYIPEHKAAADEFINEGFPTEVLLSIIEENPQPNLVSMFFYISGKRSDDEVLRAWNYLRRRIENEPDRFNLCSLNTRSPGSFNPNLLDADNCYLMFAARKYLMGKRTVFRSHIDSVKAEAQSLVRYLDILDLDSPIVVIYYQWLVNFFSEYIPKEKRLKDNYSIEKKSITDDDIKMSFQRMRDLVLNFSFDDYIAEAEKISEYPNPKRWKENMLNPKKYAGRTLFGRPFFPDVPCPYYDAVENLVYADYSLRHMLNECDDVDFRIDILNRFEEIALLKRQSNRHAYEQAVASTSLFFYLEQDVYDVGYTLDFERLFYSLEKNAEFYEPFLLPYLDEDAFFDIDSKRENRGYMALDVLLSAKSKKAYYFTKQLVQSGKLDLLKPPASNYWDYNLRGFYKLLYAGNYVERGVDVIGLAWEGVCQEIAKTYYNDALTNHEGISLENRTIPDMVIGPITRNDFGELIHVNRMIECKKSLYFAEYGNILNNETTYKYYDFCDTLEYWILEKDARFERNDIQNQSKVKCVFADDLLSASWLSNEFKDSIRTLLDEVSRRNRNPSGELITIDELCQAIDFLLEFPPPDITPISKRVNKKKERPAPTNVIRQYDSKGVFLKEFVDVRSAAMETGLRVDTITNVTRGRRNSAGGFLWRKCSVGSPAENIQPTSNALNLDGKKIIQVDENGEIVGDYATIGQAVKQSGVNRRSISDALKGIQKTAGGFIWVLAEDQTE